jgi:predicted ATP-dependent Lon-type protease
VDFRIRSKKIVKEVPTARSQSYKANQKLQKKMISTPTTSGNDVLPSPLIIPAKPITQAEGAQRAFTTVRVLHQSLLHVMSPGNHIYDICN